MAMQNPAGTMQPTKLSMRRLNLAFSIVVMLTLLRVVGTMQEIEMPSILEAQEELQHSFHELSAGVTTLATHSQEYTDKLSILRNPKGDDTVDKNAKKLEANQAVMQIIGDLVATTSKDSALTKILDAYESLRSLMPHLEAVAPECLKILLALEDVVVTAFALLQREMPDEPQDLEHLNPEATRLLQHLHLSELVLDLRAIYARYQDLVSAGTLTYYWSLFKLLFNLQALLMSLSLWASVPSPSTTVAPKSLQLVPTSTSTSDLEPTSEPAILPLSASEPSLQPEPLLLKRLLDEGMIKAKSHIATYVTMMDWPLLAGPFFLYLALLAIKQLNNASFLSTRATLVSAFHGLIFLIAIRFLSRHMASLVTAIDQLPCYEAKLQCLLYVIIMVFSTNQLLNVLTASIFWALFYFGPSWTTCKDQHVPTNKNALFVAYLYGLGTLVFVLRSYFLYP